MVENNGEKITRKNLINKYLEFFKSHQEYPHKQIPNASLVPEDDPTVLFTTAGMHPLVPFLLGQKHPQGNRLVNYQKCIRTGDIEEVGDASHHTFFEMLGNWSLGDYWKKEAIQMSYEFLTNVLEIPSEKLGVTCFAGSLKNEGNIPKDEESAEIWKSLGIPEERIAYTKEDNWWGPAGEAGPCGPDTEMFYFKSDNNSNTRNIKFNPDDEENWVEIWNDVLMQYNKTHEKGKENFKEAEQKNIDTGMGLERTLAVLNGLEDDYETEVFKPIIEKIENLSNEEYSSLEEDNKTKQAIRIITDHIKASVFIIADGVEPSNTEQGYVLRRLIRRAIKYGRVNLDLSQEKGKMFIEEVAKPVFEIYEDYSYLQENKEHILGTLRKEEDKFNKTLEKGMKEFNRIVQNNDTQNSGKVSGKDSFLLYQSYGFPLEMTKELANEKGLKVNEEEFNEEYKKHQELSKTAAEGRFKSGLADNTEETTKLHTTTHLLNQALREVLGDPEIYQKGSNINPERLRFDFNFPRKLTDEEKQKVEEWVNDKIQKELSVKVEEMSPEEAENQGAAGVFDEKYGEKVKVYFIGPDSEGNYVSKEICAGPHVSNTGEIGKGEKGEKNERKFKIKKEESSASGVRRIKGVLK